MRSPGGEIAQVGDIVNGPELAGTAVGLVALDEIVRGDRIEAGDVLIGLPSSGLHSNGYTLARSVLDGIPLDDERLGRPLGDALLEPTTIYVRAVMELIGSDADVRGLAHITGDGLNNLLRLSESVGFEVGDPLEVPEIFHLIQDVGRISDEEMFEVFNMGLGFVCIVPAADEARALELLGAQHPGAARIGTATERAGVIERL